MRLNTSVIKQLCSTDAVYAEKKYKAPFSFIPSHTLVLYTNHLPKVGASDAGTWRRLIVIPFGAKIEGDSDIKNFADYLVDHAGGAMPVSPSTKTSTARRTTPSQLALRMRKRSMMSCPSRSPSARRAGRTYSIFRKRWNP